MAKLYINLEDMHSSNVSQREYITNRIRSFSIKHSILTSDIEIKIIGHKKLKLVKNEETHIGDGGKRL